MAILEKSCDFYLMSVWWMVYGTESMFRIILAAQHYLCSPTKRIMAIDHSLFMNPQDEQVSFQWEMDTPSSIDHCAPVHTVFIWLTKWFLMSGISGEIWDLCGRCRFDQHRNASHVPHIKQFHWAIWALNMVDRIDYCAHLRFNWKRHWYDWKAGMQIGTN